MVESKDRIVREDDATEVYIMRMRSRVSNRNIESSRGNVLEVYLDQPVEATTPRTALGRETRTNGVAGEGLNRGIIRVTGRVAFGTPTTSQGPSLIGSPVIRNGSENVFPGHSGGRASRSILPFWYPRCQLQDITSIVRKYGWLKASKG